jgi:hypothetical protein
MRRSTHSSVYTHHAHRHTNDTLNSLCFNSTEEQESVLPQAYPRQTSFCFPDSDRLSFVSCHSRAIAFPLAFPQDFHDGEIKCLWKDPFRNCVPQTDKHGDLKIKGWF